MSQAGNITSLTQYTEKPTENDSVEFAGDEKMKSLEAKLFTMFEEKFSKAKISDPFENDSLKTIETKLKNDIGTWNKEKSEKNATNWKKILHMLQKKLLLMISTIREVDLKMSKEITDAISTELNIEFAKQQADFDIIKFSALRIKYDAQTHIEAEFEEKISAATKIIYDLGEIRKTIETKEKEFTETAEIPQARESTLRLIKNV